METAGTRSVAPKLAAVVVVTIILVAAAVVLVVFMPSRSGSSTTSSLQTAPSCSPFLGLPLHDDYANFTESGSNASSASAYQIVPSGSAELETWYCFRSSGTDMQPSIGPLRTTNSTWSFEACGAQNGTSSPDCTGLNISVSPAKLDTYAGLGINITFTISVSTSTPTGLYLLTLPGTQCDLPIMIAVGGAGQAFSNLPSGFSIAPDCISAIGYVPPSVQIVSMQGFTPINIPIG